MGHPTGAPTVLRPPGYICDERDRDGLYVALKRDLAEHVRTHVSFYGFLMFPLISVFSENNYMV